MGDGACARRRRREWATTLRVCEEVTERGGDYTARVRGGDGASGRPTLCVRGVMGRAATPPRNKPEEYSGAGRRPKLVLEPLGDADTLAM